jgi:hypothetical protein
MGFKSAIDDAFGLIIRDLGSCLGRCANSLLWFLGAFWSLLLGMAALVGPLPSYSYLTAVLFSYQYISYSLVHSGLVDVTMHNPPSLHALYSPASFIDSVVSQYKVTCEFDSGNSFYEQNDVARAISMAYLPVGMWASIEGFFPDSIPDGYSSWTTDGNMRLSYCHTMMPDGVLSWRCTVSLETGVPLHVYAMTGFVMGYTLVATLVA